MTLSSRLKALNPLDHPSLLVNTLPVIATARKYLATGSERCTRDDIVCWLNNREGRLEVCPEVKRGPNASCQFRHTRPQLGQGTASGRTFGPQKHKGVQLNRSS